MIKKLLMKRLLLVLILCSPCWAGNLFTSDPNCVALYNFESAAILADSKGNNTLTGAPDPNTTLFKQGSASGEWDGTSGMVVYRNDGDLSADFPFKNGTSNLTYSICFWWMTHRASWISYYMTEKRLAAAPLAVILSKSNQKVKMWASAGVGMEFEVASTLFAADTWYHVAVTYNGATREARISVWNDTLKALVAPDVTGTLDAGAAVNAERFQFGAAGTSSVYRLIGLADELVIFNVVLTVEEIDEIRSGTYGAPTGPIEGNAFMSTYNPN